MIGATHINTINAWGECQTREKPFPLEEADDLYVIRSLTSNEWHWHEDIPKGYVQVENWQLHELDDERTYTSCPSCDIGIAVDPDGESSTTDDEDLLCYLAAKWDEPLYVILLDGEGVVFLAKEK